MATIVTHETIDQQIKSRQEDVDALKECKKLLPKGGGVCLECHSMYSAKELANYRTYCFCDYESDRI